MGPGLGVLVKGQSWKITMTWSPSNKEERIGNDTEKKRGKEFCRKKRKKIF